MLSSLLCNIRFNCQLKACEKYFLIWDFSFCKDTRGHKILPDTLLICGIVLDLRCVYPGLQCRGRVGVKLNGAELAGGQWSLAQPLAQPLELRTTGRSRSSIESQGLNICLITTFLIYRNTHKIWNFRDGCTELTRPVSLYSVFPATKNL